MAGNILFEFAGTSAYTFTDAYADITGMASGSVSVEGTDSLVLIMTTVGMDSDDADAGCWVAIFVDDTMVAEAMGGADSTDGEPQPVHLAWAEKGLSAGNHDFDIRARETTGSTWDNCALISDITRAVQVIEFKDSDVTTAIRLEQTSTTEDSTATSSFTTLDNLGGSFTTVADAIYLVLASITVNDDAGGSGDISTEFRIMIDGTERQTVKAWSDSTSEGGNAGIFLWEDEDFGTSSIAFQIEWKEEQAEARADGGGGGTPQEGAQRHLQVIEFSGANAPTILAEARQTSSQSFSASFQDVTGMDLNPTIDGTDALIIASGVFNIGTGGSDISCKVQLRLGGTVEIQGEAYADAGDEEGSVTLAFAETGIAAGSRNYDMQVQNGQSTCIGANSPSPTPQNMLQIVEFQAGGAGSFTENMTDELGMEDILTTVASFILAFTDELGAEDVMTISLQAAFTDEMGIDSVFEDLFSSRKDFTDEMGAEDVQSQRHSFVRPFTDEVGIEDTIEAVEGGGDSFTENMTDEIGIDEIFTTAKGQTETFTDEIGIEDTITREISISESFTDELGLDEFFGTSGGVFVEFTDEIGIEDTIATASSFNINIQGSDIGMEDSIDVSQGTTVNLVDELGMDDSFEFQLGVIYFTDEIGIDENFSNTTPTGLLFNAIILSVNSPEFDRLGGVFAVSCPSNSTLTGLLTNGTFVCSPMSDFFP